MAKKTVDLCIATDSRWVDVVLGDFNAFLADHANCERKASALSLSFLVRYPDRERILPDLVAHAQEELEHFRQVFELMRARGVLLVRDSKDRYANAMMPRLRHGRDDRFLDRLLFASLAESRGGERFRLLSQNLEDPTLQRYYRELTASEMGHADLFVNLALMYFESDVVYERLHEMAQWESEIIASLPLRPALY